MGPQQALLALLLLARPHRSQGLKATRFVEVGWKFFLSTPGYDSEYAAAGECSRSWEQTKSALWVHEQDGSLRLQNSSLCLENRNITRDPESPLGESSELRLSPCNSSTLSSQRWNIFPGVQMNNPFVSAKDGRCLGISPGNTSILDSTFTRSGDC